MDINTRKYQPLICDYEQATTVCSNKNHLITSQNKGQLLDFAIDPKHRCEDHLKKPLLRSWWNIQGTKIACSI